MINKPVFIALSIIAVIIWAFAIAQITHAAQPTSWPTSLNDIDVEISGSNIAAVWKQDNGGYFCWAGQVTNAITWSWTLPDKRGDETLIAYLDRAKPQLFTREVSESEMALCNEILARIPKVVWIVDQWRTAPTRPVYVINDPSRVVNDPFPSIKVRLKDANGNDVSVPHSQPCGDKVADYSATITAYQWRKVTVDGLVGAAVCREK